MINMSDKRYLAARTGNMEQIAYARRSVLTEGKADGIRIIDINNGGGLSCTLLESRCLDISRVEYRGVNIGFLAKPGLVAPQFCEPGGFVRYFQAGMLYTCGLDNVGPACRDDRGEWPMHGRLGITPAGNVKTDINWDNDEILISGKVGQGALFGPNLVFERHIRIPLFGKDITIEDRIENQGFGEEEIMLLYHLNIGWPMLSEDAVLEITNDGRISGRDSEAEKGIDRWNLFEAPSDLRPEQAFYHSPVCSDDGNAHAVVWNKKIKLGIDISFDPSVLPYLVEWKSMASGDYALGIEPSTCLVGGRESEKRAGRILLLKPYETMDFRITLKVVAEKENSKKGK